MRLGDIYHLDEVKALHGGSPKGRYVVIVTSQDEVILDNPIFVVACTASLLPAQVTDEVIAFPWHRDGMATTGFRRPTYAVPKWMLKVKPSDLAQHRTGYVNNKKLQAIIERLPKDPISDST